MDGKDLLKDHEELLKDLEVAVRELRSMQDHFAELYLARRSDRPLLLTALDALKSPPS